MKRIVSVFFFVATVLSLASCQKEGPATVSSAKEQVDCLFSLAGDVDIPSTKAVGLESDAKGTTAEKSVKNLQVFVFDSTGTCVTSRYVTNSGNIHLTVDAGDGYTFYAVANIEDITAQVSTVAELLDRTTDVLGTEDGSSRFPMQGTLKDQTVSPLSKSFSIEVERRAAKIVLRNITNSLPVDYGDIIVEGIYLSNVVTVSGMFSDDLPQEPLWANRMGAYDSLSSHDWLSDKLSVAVAVGRGGVYDIAHTFYAAANAVETDTREEPWSPRFTRLVVRTSIQGITRYYPITFGEELPSLKANEYIDVTNLNIKSLGPLDPEKPITTEEVSVTVTVKDWNRTEHMVNF